MPADTVQYTVIMTTCPDKETADKIIDCLLNEKLAACIQFSGIKSCYTWKGKVHKDDELLLYIKAKTELYDKIQAKIIENHSYEVPEIIQIPIIKGYGPYLQWIDEVSI